MKLSETVKQEGPRDLEVDGEYTKASRLCIERLSVLREIRVQQLVL